MIGYLTLGQFLILCAFAFGFLALFVLLLAEKMPPREVKGPVPESITQMVERVDAEKLLNEHDYSAFDLDDSTPESVSQYLARHRGNA